MTTDRTPTRPARPPRDDVGVVLGYLRELESYADALALRERSALARAERAEADAAVLRAAIRRALDGCDRCRDGWCSAPAHDWLRTAAESTDAGTALLAEITAARALREHQDRTAVELVALRHVERTLREHMPALARGDTDAWWAIDGDLATVEAARGAAAASPDPARVATIAKTNDAACGIAGSDEEISSE